MGNRKAHRTDRLVAIRSGLITIFTRFIGWKNVRNNKSGQVSRAGIIESETDYLIEQLQNQILDSDNQHIVITKKDAHIFRFLMSVWYKFLSIDYRNNLDMKHALDADMQSYLQMLQSKQAFLSASVTDDANTQVERAKDAAACAHECEMIEAMFAARIGTEAIEALKKIHDMDGVKFSRRGDIAPDGFYYGEGDELKPIGEAHS